MVLRDYQEETKAAVLKEFETVNSTLVVWPTGAGKTVLAASLAKHFFPKRSMFICHRDTLVFQTKRIMEEEFDLRCDIDMAGLKAEEGLFGKCSVVISTVQTQLAGRNGERRMKRFDPLDFDFLIVDEFHHYASPEWKKVLDYYRQNPKLKLLGVTASPDRHDELALGQLVETVAKDYEILDAIHDGWLVPVDQQMVRVSELDYSQVRITAGDLNGGDLAKILEAEKICQGMTGSAIEIVGDRQFVFFTASVAQAEMVSNIFNRHRQGMCKWIFEGTSKEDRRTLLDGFKRKEIQGLANVGILTEGWDDRNVAVCFMGRPTASRCLYAQQAGRILRPLEGVIDGPPTPEERKAAIAASAKPSALIVDFVGNAGKHKLMSSADILGGKVSEAAIDRAKKKAEESGEAVRMDDLLDKSEEEIRQEIEKRRFEEEARKAKLVAKVQYQTKEVNPFDVLQIQPVRARGWDDGRQLTLKQRNILFKQGIDSTQLPYAQAKQLLDEVFRRWNRNLCSFRQARVLRKHAAVVHRYPASLVKVNRDEAAAILDIIAYQERWAKKT